MYTWMMKIAIDVALEEIVSKSTLLYGDRTQENA
jgi:hypothetical protein